MKVAVRITALLVAGSACAPSAVLAIEAIPATPGWRGFVVAGAGYADLRSNFVAGNSLIDIGQPTINSIDARPRSDDTFHPVITGEVNYSFGNRWQAFFGTSIEDAVTLDGVTQLGVRHDLGAAGIVQAGFLFSGVPTEVWDDPYAEGVVRDETDRDSSGLRLQWDRVMGSPLELTFSYRDVSVDRERSGQGVDSVPCDLACQALLRRDGDQYSLGVSWLFRLDGGQRHLLRPMVRYQVDDRDGEAVSNDAWQAQLSYVFTGQGYTVASNIAVGSSSHDASNPLFGVKTDADRLALDTTLFYRLPTASGRWQAVGSVLWGEDDSDVAFHDSRLFMFSIGALYRFGER